MAVSERAETRRHALCAYNTWRGVRSAILSTSARLRDGGGEGAATREENTSYRAWRFVTKTSPPRLGLQCGVRASYFDGKESNISINIYSS